MEGLDSGHRIDRRHVIWPAVNLNVGARLSNFSTITTSLASLLAWQSVASSLAPSPRLPHSPCASPLVLVRDPSRQLPRWRVYSLA